MELCYVFVLLLHKIINVLNFQGECVILYFKISKVLLNELAGTVTNLY